jgi:hypothetical protein
VFRAQLSAAAIGAGKARKNAVPGNLSANRLFGDVRRLRQRPPVIKAFGLMRRAAPDNPFPALLCVTLAGLAGNAESARAKTFQSACSYTSQQRAVKVLTALSNKGRLTWAVDLQFLLMLAALLFASVASNAVAQQPIPDNSHSRELKALIGRTIWYAPHIGCLDKITKESSLHVPTERYFPDQPAPLVVRELKYDPTFGYRFVLLSGSTDLWMVDANYVLTGVTDKVFGASMFYNRCYFNDDPSIVEAVLRKQDPIEFDVYHGYTADQRQDLIKEIVDSDKLSFDLAKRHMAQAKKPGVKVGMSPEQVRNGSSWGKPLSVNNTITAGRKSEQWVYGDGQYLYFVNGVLTAIQN